MKRILLVLVAVAVPAVTMFGQGRVLFNNISAADPTPFGIKVAASGGKAGQGAANAYIGSAYSIQLLWGTAGQVYANLAAFLAANPSSSAPVSFIGTTGGSPGTDGAGLFDGGTIPNPVGTSMPAGTYQMVARAWFGAPSTTYTASANAGNNVGYSQIFTLAATAFPAGANNTVFPAFTVVPIPEPSTMALAGLGVAALLAFRRRK